MRERDRERKRKRERDGERDEYAIFDYLLIIKSLILFEWKVNKIMIDY